MGRSGTGWGRRGGALAKSGGPGRSAHAPPQPRREHFDAINQFVVQRPPYEVPCVVASPILAVDPAYAQWIITETSVVPG